MLSFLLALLIILITNFYQVIGVPTYGTVVRDDGCTVNPCLPYHGEE